MVGKLGKNRLTLARSAFLLALSILLGSSEPQAGPVRSVILLWDHDAGPFCYNVYEATNLGVTPVQWTLVTNTTTLSVQLPAEEGEHFFRVSCVDTNTGLESLLVNR